MKECYKNFIVGFVVVVVVCGLVVLFFIKPEILIKLCLLAMLFGLFYLCCIIGEKIRESSWYEDLILYIKRMLNKWKRKGV